ncbi:outer membrane protein [Oceanospirillum multiglobuliferum]|uniref:Outer membrane protein n=1 Tax=Oceanospirillum multiglobuliferum TaxID=64969 RepID=A0A1T4KWF7_9GAMM|nr:TIGR04219 family outer membrane beta-barrel protein [Oceanospirillum multiglobuliferum]OPX54980.1 hypothetical protein BTE48_11620 [Oceanospirillum multiglobuliferum]SJZ46746.1 outer membrane protein [Oceanospirillum multiglobuliferum]
MKLTKLASVALLSAGVLSAAGAQADIAGVYAGTSLWQPSLSGSFKADSDSSANNSDLESTLGFDDSSATSLFIAIEHPLPLIPNIRIERTHLSETATTKQSGTFLGTNYSTNKKAKLDLSHTDWTAYYELLDGLGWMAFDVGVTLRNFDGEFKVDTKSLDLNAPVPLAYGKADFFIPATNFSVGALVNYLDIGGATVFDRRFYAAYESDFIIGAELGYRSFSLDLSDVDDIDADLSMSGFYAGATVHF